MDFTISKEDLLAAIDKCAVAANDPKHVTASFRVMTVDATKNKTVRFCAVGESCTVDTVMPAEVKAKGVFSITPKHLRDLASAMPAGRIQLSLKGARVTMKSCVSARKATFQHNETEVFKVEDPGKDASWVEVNSQELARALRIVKAAYHPWENRPDMALLIPTPRGLDVFGSNGQIISIVQTNIRVESKNNIELVGPVIESLFQMVDDDDKVRIFADPNRVFLENCDTLVSGALPADYPFRDNYVHAIANMKDDAMVRGPVFDPGLLHAGVKSVLSASGFSNESEKKVGMALDLTLGSDTVVVEFKVGDADARDEFDAIASGAEIVTRIDAGHLLKVLGSMAGIERVQALSNGAVFVMQSQGFACAIATRTK